MSRRRTPSGRVGGVDGTPEERLWGPGSALLGDPSFNYFPVTPHPPNGFGWYDLEGGYWLSKLGLEHWDVFLHCDSPSHGRKPVAVENFRQSVTLVSVPGIEIATGQETEVPLHSVRGWHAVPRKQGVEMLGLSHVNVYAEPGPDRFRGPFRLKWQLRCRRCGFEINERHESLAVALDTVGEHGMSRVSMHVLSGILKELRKRDMLGPAESGPTEARG